MKYLETIDTIETENLRYQYRQGVEFVASDIGIFGLKATILSLMCWQVGFILGFIIFFSALSLLRYYMFKVHGLEQLSHTDIQFWASSIRDPAHIMLALVFEKLDFDKAKEKLVENAIAKHVRLR